jgi:myo-inositol 2-dehydrogenase / D-chiro-inositol 1-dehydrogenase
MSKMINVCLIGAGRAGMLHARNFQSKVPQARMAAVSDPLEKACGDACEELGIDKYYLDYKDALNDTCIDAMVVVAPTKHHKQIVVDCANAGKHIFCEKPMAMTVAECDEMIAAVQANNVKLQIGFMRRFDESFRKAKEAIDSGEIGELVHIRSLTRGPSKPMEWMYDIQGSNGPLAEVSSHDIDCIRWFSGSEVELLYAVAGNFRNKEIASKYPDFYDNVVVTGKFKNGIQFTIEGSQYVEYGYDARVEVLGTKGVVFIGRNDAYNFKIVSIKSGSRTPFINSWTTLFKDAYLEEDIEFIQCIINNTEPKVTGLDGKMAVAVVKAGNQSIKENKIIEL